MNPLWLLFIAWLLFYSLHSLLASSFVKSKVKNLLGRNYRYYRLAYNFLNITLLAAILWYQFSLQPHFFLSVNVFTQSIGAGLFIVGSALLIAAFASFNKAEFAGVEQIRTDKQKKQQKTELITDSGMYGYVRHPLYFAMILMFLGVLIFRPTYAMLVFVGITFIYLPIGVRLEEQKLIDEFGEDYVNYRKKVKMLIPYIF